MKVSLRVEMALLGRAYVDLSRPCSGKVRSSELKRRHSDASKGGRGGALKRGRGGASKRGHGSSTSH